MRINIAIAFSLLNNKMMQMTSACKALAKVLQHELPGNLAAANAQLRVETSNCKQGYNGCKLQRRLVIPTDLIRKIHVIDS